MYFTGNKEHNIAMRQRAIERGLRLNDTACSARRPRRATRAAGPVPDGGGNLRAARVELHPAGDARGPRANRAGGEGAAAPPDGMDGPERLAAQPLDLERRPPAAGGDRQGDGELGLAYWGDHGPFEVVLSGQRPGCGARCGEQLKEIASHQRHAGEGGSDFRLLTGTEVDILKDGTLDFPDDLLAELDVVIASIHSELHPKRGRDTQRLIGAAQNPYVHILGHLTGRLLLEREPYKVDQRAVIDACAETGTWIELNAHPMRFDMDWRLWPYAKSKGVKCAINCDAHRSSMSAFSAWAPASPAKAGSRKKT